VRAWFGHSDEVAAFVAALIPGCERGFGDCQAIGFLNVLGALEAGAVYHNWNPEAEVIEISAASKHRRWGSLARLRLIFEYPFEQIGCQMVVARTAEDNPAPLRIWRTLGADEFRIPRLRGRGRAEIITTLTAEAWAASRFARAYAHGKA